jgi:hypothetical protein
MDDPNGPDLRAGTLAVHRVSFHGVFVVVTKQPAGAVSHSG